jgi:DNA-binding transcriptional regulator of glucitol operon
MGTDLSELIAWLAQYAGILWQEQKFSEAEQTYVQVNGLRVHNAIAANESHARTLHQ